eukprot:8550392-Alexandrium_andersonii.AAC.1
MLGRVSHRLMRVRSWFEGASLGTQQHMQTTRMPPTAYAQHHVVEGVTLAKPTLRHHQARHHGMQTWRVRICSEHNSNCCCS